MKKILTLILTLCICLGMSACNTVVSNSNNFPREKSEREKIEEAIENRRLADEILDRKFGSKIGDYEINSHSISITNMEKLSNTEYIVNGRVTLTDIYGTKYSNTFDCKVTSSDGENWHAGDFRYKNDYWTKG